MNQHEYDATRERHEELLETIGVHLEKGPTTISDLEEHDITFLTLQELTNSNHIAIDEDNRVKFLPKGEREFLSLIRRHRLAERLMHDVLDFRDEDGSEGVVCKMEHIITEEVTDSICTLLGHPTTCPHGRPIPRGRCCELKKDRVKPLILPLSMMEVGDKGNIAFISQQEKNLINRLAAMGLFPGVKILLQQKKPVIVIHFEETMLSMDKEYAEAVYVRRT
jgi:DtxR family Mn-dependent transcriptional regulator